MYLFNGAGREVYLSHVLCGIEIELVALRATLFLRYFEWSITKTIFNFKFHSYDTS